MVSDKICVYKWNTAFLGVSFVLELNQVYITWRKPWNTIACCHCWHKSKAAKKGCMVKCSSPLPLLLCVTWIQLQCLLMKGLELDLKLCFNRRQHEFLSIVRRILRGPSFIVSLDLILGKLPWSFLEIFYKSRSCYVTYTFAFLDILVTISGNHRQTEDSTHRFSFSSC